MKAKPAPEPITEDPSLPAAFYHVLYEIEMLYAAAQLTIKSQKRTHQHNAFLESFVVHARCLAEFFSAKPKRKEDDDVRATDFFADFPTSKNPETKRMHKEIVHLTHSRKKPGEVRGWDVSKTARPLQVIALTFLKQASSKNNLMFFDRNKEKTAKLIRLLSSDAFGDATRQQRLAASSASSPANVSSYSVARTLVGGKVREPERGNCRS